MQQLQLALHLLPVGVSEEPWLPVTVYFQQGREVFTFDAPPTAKAGVLLRARDNGDGQEEVHEAAHVRSAVAWSLGSIYTTAAAVLATPRMDSQ